MTNPRVKTSRAEECDERENSIKITVRPWEAAIFSCTPEEKKERRPRRKDSSEKNCGEENSCKERNSSDQGNSLRRKRQRKRRNRLRR